MGGASVWHCGWHAWLARMAEEEEEEKEEEEEEKATSVKRPGQANRRPRGPSWQLPTTRDRGD